MTAGESSGAYLLPVTVALAERQRSYAAEVLHDGPMQEFTAVLLGLGQLRSGLDADHAARLTELETRLRDTVATLRAPASVWRTDVAPPALLEAVLRSWVTGVLAERLDLTVDTVDGASLDRRDVAAAAGLVQLVLHQADPTTAARSARVTVLGRPDVVEIRIQLARPARRAGAGGQGGDEGDEGDGDGLIGLAAALGAQLSRLTDSGQVDCDWVFEACLPREAGLAATTPPDRPRPRRLRDHLRRRAG